MKRLTTQPDSRFATAAILAGGLSRRMGYDKYRLEIDGRRLLDSLIARLRDDFPQIIVVANTDDILLPDDIALTRDIFAGQGPLAGLHAALIQSRGDYVFLTACDMPLISRSAIQALRAGIGKRMPDVICWRTGGQPQPFQAFYHRRLIPELEQRLTNGRRKTRDLLAEADCLILDSEDHLLAAENFTNINTPQELTEWTLKANRKEDSR